MIASGNRIVYDGDCPLCTSFVQRLRLMRSAGPIELIDARDRPDLARQLQEQGMSLDQGIVLCVGSECVHADAAMTRLALLSTRSDLFNRLVYWIFSRPRWARSVYPVLRVGRNLLLRIRGRERLSSWIARERKQGR